MEEVLAASRRREDARFPRTDRPLQADPALGAVNAVTSPDSQLTIPSIPTPTPTVAWSSNAWPYPTPSAFKAPSLDQYSGGLYAEDETTMMADVALPFDDAFM